MSCSVELCMKKVLYPQAQPGHPPSLIKSESSLGALTVAKGLSYLHADSENSYQTGRMSRLSVAKGLSYLHADSENSYQTGRMSRLSVAKGLSYLHADSGNSYQTGRMSRLW